MDKLKHNVIANCFCAGHEDGTRSLG